ncbi:enoyl-CoA hydratase/isomerase family protein [Mycolicibacterium gilvum]|nr:enoyl-CoA hydratase/isomerase family protein [Mycolicibacterium gilvum]
MITVNDPDRRSAVTDAMSAQLRSAVERAEADETVHAVVVTGAGKAFCAGADLSALGEAAEEGLPELYDGFMALANCSLPTIAAVNEAAVGARLNLALAADVELGSRCVALLQQFSAILLIADDMSVEAGGVFA